MSVGADAVQAVKGLARSAGLRRSTVASVRMRVERTTMATRGPAGSRPGGRILAYHTVGTPSWGVNDVTPARFRRQLELARREGHRFVPAVEIARTGGEPGDLAVTFDDGMVSVARHAAPILRDLGIPWTLFVVTGWADGAHGFGDDLVLGWDGLARLVTDSLCTIGSHSCTHPRFPALEHGQVIDELAASQAILRDRLGIAADTFAVPFGQSRDWTPACQEAASSVYEFVYAQAEQTRTPGTIGRTFVSRFDGDRVFRAALGGTFDRWEEWY